MDVVSDIPLALRSEQLTLARKIKRISLKVQAQSLIRHPEDWEHLVEDLAEASEQLEVLMEKIKNLH